MKDRIKQFIEYQNVSAGDLAVMLDVQRSNISHILNGRNKPGAVFIEKLLLKFPDLNARWLLTGKGEMIGTSGSATILKTAAPTLFDEETETEAVADTAPKVLKQNPPVEKSDVPQNNDEVDKIIIVYRDGTFSQLKPRENTTNNK